MTLFPVPTFSCARTLGDPDYLFDTITAVVAGGTRQTGGSGSVVATVIGAIFVGIINNLQKLMNISTYWQQIGKGPIILFAVILDRISRKGRKG